MLRRLLLPNSRPLSTYANSGAKSSQQPQSSQLSQRPRNLLLAALRSPTLGACLTLVATMAMWCKVATDLSKQHPLPSTNNNPPLPLPLKRP
jgi:hypothetical protein